MLERSDFSVQITITPDAEENADSNNNNQGSSNTPPTVQTGDIGITWAIISIAILLIINVLLIKKIKKKVLAIIIIVVVGVVALGISVYAISEGLQTKLDNLPETINWLDSENYLVTENTVERIMPQTSCEAFKQQFSKPITVFKDNNEISTGLIGTGMKVQTETEKNTYLISVLADISGDGESNTIDLTKVIRYVLNSKEWDLSGIQ